MNATFFLLGAACLGADPAAVPVHSQAPVVTSAHGCGGCGDAGYGYATASSYGHSGCSNDCGSGSREGFFSRLKSKLCHKKSSSCNAPDACAPTCAPAPVACAPAPVACAPAPMACASDCAPACKSRCGGSLFAGCKSDPCKPCLFDRMKSKFKRSSSGSSSCGGCDSYAAPAVAGCSTGPALIAPNGPAIPPKEMPIPPKEDPKKTTLAPIAPLSPAEFAGTAGKY